MGGDFVADANTRPSRVVFGDFDECLGSRSPREPRVIGVGRTVSRGSSDSSASPMLTAGQSGVPHPRRA